MWHSSDILRQFIRIGRPRKPFLGASVFAVPGLRSKRNNAMSYSLDGGDADEPQQVPRVSCISDIHVDIAENMKWIEKLPAKHHDILLVAGDISDDMRLVRKALRSLKSKYADVFCVPGNHDLWVRKGEGNSMDKLHSFLALCEEEAVLTAPRRVCKAPDGTGGVWIVPLLSWHHQSFDSEPDITCWEGIPTAEQAMMDYHRCKWPEPLQQSDDSVAEAVDALNEGRADLPSDARDVAPIISFSHFVPHVELSPEKRFLFLPTLSKAIGSRFLGERIERLGSCLHVFGHTHFGWDATFRGTRFVQAALGYPLEWEQRPASMEIGSLPHEPVVLWDSRNGFVPPFPARWSGYYEKNARRPDLSHMLAPYVAPHYKQLDGGQICDWPMGRPPS